LTAHELKYNFNDSDQNYAFMIEIVLGLPPTPATLRNLTRDQVMLMVMAPLALGFGPDSPLDPWWIKFSLCQNLERRTQSSKRLHF
jgi:hypothetical protein